MIVSCGEALVDLVPDAVPGGGPMNAAIAAARLDAAAAFVGRVSNDAYGEMIWAHLEANGVDLRACERGSEPTARAIVEHVPKTSFRFEGTDTADTQLTRVALDLLDDGPHIIHGGTLGMFRGPTAEVLAAAVESHDGIVSLDPNVRPQIIDDRDRWDHFHDRWCSGADIYKASDEDLAWIWPNRSAESCAEELLAGAASVVVMTSGDSGATAFTSAGQCDVAPPAPVDVIDTVGAGDTLIGSLLTSVSERADVAGQPDVLQEIPLAEWKSMLRRAVIAAGITCGRPGADPPTRAELDIAADPQ